MQTLEIQIVRRESSVDVTVGEQRSAPSILDLAPFLDADAGRDVAVFGNNLARLVFSQAQLDLLAALEPASRILLSVADHRLATIPWEALRMRDGELLAARCAFTRWTPSIRTRPTVTAGTMLNLVAVPVAPIDGYQPVLATEREYRGLETTVAASAKAVRLFRVRPPTVEATGRALRPGTPAGLFFMGHSDSRDGRSVLAFEDASGRTRLVEARELAAVLNDDVIFVVLNSCWSAKADSATKLGNVARGLAQQGIPYALGMQSELRDDAAILLTRELLRSLLAGAGFEEAVRQVRTFFVEGAHNDDAWVATLPVCYTASRTPSTTLIVADGVPEIEPSPVVIAARMDLSALQAPEELVGRGAELSAILDALSYGGAVVLHGLGGIGKTALARAAAERGAWRYDDRVLGLAFDTADETFVERFMGRLGRFFDVESDVGGREAMAERIIAASKRTKALLVLDNAETLFEAFEQGVSSAVWMGSMVQRLAEGETALLLTSRLIPPESWSTWRIVEVRGLGAEAGGALFLRSLRPERRKAADIEGASHVARRVEGHPLGIRLLAGQFGTSNDDLRSFIDRLEQVLAHSGEPLEACIRTSVERLDAAERSAIETWTLFQAPFLAVFAAALLDLQAESISSALDDLVGRGLLSRRRETWDQETITLYDIHQTLRWYLSQRTSPPSREVMERFGRVFSGFATYVEDLDALSRQQWARRVVFSSLPDFATALQFLEPLERGMLQYRLARPLEYFGQILEARRLAESALEIGEEYDDAMLMTAALLRIGDLMGKMGETADAILPLYDRAIVLSARLGPASSATSQIHAQIGELLLTMRRPEEALASYRLAREAIDHVDPPDPQQRRVKEAQGDYKIARALRELRRYEEALDLFESSIPILLSGSPRAASVALDEMGAVLHDLERYPEALRARERATDLMQELGDERAAAVIRGNLAMTLTHLGRIDEARTLLEHAVIVLRKSGDELEAAAAEEKLSLHLFLEGRLTDAIRTLWAAHRTYKEIGTADDVQRTIGHFRELKAHSGVRVFSQVWRATLHQAEPPWLADVKDDPEAIVSQTILGERALTTALQNTFNALQPENREWREQWRQNLIEVNEELAHDDPVLSTFHDALLAVVDGRPSQLPHDHLYYIPFQEMLAAARLPADPELPRLRQAIEDFLMARSPEGLAHSIDEHREVLERGPEIVNYLHVRGAHESAKGNREFGEALENCAAILANVARGKIGDVIEHLAEAATQNDASPAALAERAARATFGDTAEQQAIIAQLEQLIAIAASDDERFFYGALRVGVVEGDTDFLTSFPKGPLADAWQWFRRTITSGGLDYAVFERLRNGVLAAVVPEADESAKSTSRHLLTTMRNEAIASGLMELARFVDALTALVNAHACGTNVLASDIGSIGANLRGTFQRVWREILAQARKALRPRMRPELLRATDAYLNRSDQTGTIEMFRAYATELVCDEVIDNLRVLLVEQRGIEFFERNLETHIRLLEWAQQYGLAGAVTRDVLTSFLAEKDPTLLLPVFQVSADLLSIEAAEEFFSELEWRHDGNPAGQASLLRKQRLFRRIVEHGASAALAEEARREGKRDTARAFVAGFFERVLSPDSQEEHVRQHESLLRDPEMASLIAEIAEDVMAGASEHASGETVQYSIAVQMDILDRCRTKGIEATFRHRRQLLGWLLKILEATKETAREIARRIDAESPGALTSDEALELLFDIQHNLREQQMWSALDSVRRLIGVHARWRESGLDPAFDEYEMLAAHQPEFLEVLRELVEANGPSATQSIIERHAELLLEPSTDDRLSEMMNDMQQSSPPEVYAFVSHLRELLKRCRAIGIDVAVRESFI